MRLFICDVADTLVRHLTLPALIVLRVTEFGHVTVIRDHNRKMIKKSIIMNKLKKLEKAMPKKILSDLPI